MIKIIVEGFLPITPRKARRLREAVRGRMAADGFSGISTTGRGAAWAVEWCEEQGVPYVLRGTPGKGYTVTIAEKAIKEMLSS
jgi:hypothetical protein